MKRIRLIVAMLLLLCLCFSGCSGSESEAAVDDSYEVHVEAQGAAGVISGAGNSDSSVNAEASAESSAEPEQEAETEAFTEPATQEPAESTTEATTEPAHTHSFSPATCTTPKTCECGATEGEEMGHSWKEANYTEAAACTACGLTEGQALDHKYADGKCTFCGATEPGNSDERMVWIPTNGGKKYHSHSDCSNMIDPEYVTISEAEALGFTPCKKCY